MTVRVVRIGASPTVTGVVLLTPVGPGASVLDDLGDVSGAAAGLTGQVLTRQASGQWQPATPSAVGSVDQVRLTRTAAVALSGHRAVTPRADGTLEYASNTTPGHVHAPVWITTGAAAQGSPVDVVAYGALTEPSWSWAPGPLYLGAAGVLTQAPPTAPGALFLGHIGYATGATSVVVDRRASIALT